VGWPDDDSAPPSFAPPRSRLAGVGARRLHGMSAPPVSGRSAGQGPPGLAGVGRNGNREPRGWTRRLPRASPEDGWSGWARAV